MNICPLVLSYVILDLDQNAFILGVYEIHTGR
jgi:hypothetical protein